ncbi:ZIP family metal transporter [Oceanibaculum pacificum]|uniref:ZIP family zinc transporter n=1 Tax=Oceanibaculum pacificum TaxID=580166 RepID=A0A154WEM9_9PROT|nr:hypothetical protein [Oceanibaculum pacificum]KZD11977.1 hypothetical protein AUP43_05745 [Oceanibaculum pacificum]
MQVTEFLLVLGIAVLPGVGSLIGTSIAEFSFAPQWIVGVAMHAAAGVAIALISVELMPRILQDTPPWQVATCFLGGGLLSILLARAARIGRWLAGGGSTSAWMVYIASAADLMTDGLMTGIGVAVSTDFGLLLAFSQVVANVPAGFASIAVFRAEGVRRRARIMIAVSFLAPLLGSAAVGYLLLRDAEPALQNAALAFVVGVLLLATVEDTLPEGDKPQPPRRFSTAAFAVGFAGMVLFSGYFG